MVNPEAALDYATLHDERMWSCLCRLLDISPNLCDCVAKQCATLPLVLGGLGLRSAVRTRLPAHGASWADCFPMIKARHPEVAASMVEGLQRVDITECLRAVACAAEELSRLPGFVLPSWEALANGARPPVREPDQHEPGCQRAGWQHEGSARLEEAFRESLFVTMTDSERALVRSQGGPGAGAAYSACPITRIDPHLFRTLHLRRLRLPLLLSKRTCRCGRPLDSRGHHRAACARAGVLGRRGFAVESVAARICREGGARVVTNMMVRDMDLAAPNPNDSRRLEIVADGLPLFGGAQLAIDTTLVSVLHCDGSARAGVAHVDGAAVAVARRRKERTYPELVGQRARTRLVVLAGEVGGGWSGETRSSLCQLAKAKARQMPIVLRRRTEQAWRLRWQA